MGFFQELRFETEQESCADRFMEAFSAECEDIENADLFEKSAQGGSFKVAFIGGGFGKDACSVGIGEELDALIMEVAKADPEAPFSAEFKISCDLCGDDLWTKYEYRNGKLTTKGIAYQEGVPSYCEDCDAEFEDYCNDLNDPEHFDFSKKYTCPECGAALECDVCGWRSVYALDAHKWKRVEIEQFPKD